MLITAIEKRRKMLSALFLDGEFAVNIDTETLLQFRYKIGMDITDEQLHELILASDARRANEKALYLLEHRSHSKKELIEKIQRTTSKEAARSAADRMEELGLVNDEEFAKRYAAELFNRKGFSGRRAQYELLQKGIDKEIIAHVVEELEPNPVEKIKEIIEKKYLRCLQDEKGYRRAVNGLQRLGYRYEDIKQAISCFSCEGDEDIYYE